MDSARKQAVFQAAVMWIDKIQLIDVKAAAGAASMPSVEDLKNKKGAFEAAEQRRSELMNQIVACARELVPNIDALDVIQMFGVTIIDAHVLALALGHVAKTIKAMAGELAPETDAVAAQFMDEWIGLRDVRDILEHEEEYMAGRGRFPDRVDPAWNPPTVGWSRDIGRTRMGVVSIGVQGVTHNLRRCIELAYQLRPLFGVEARRAVEGRGA